MVGYGRLGYGIVWNGMVMVCMSCMYVCMYVRVYVCMYVRMGVSLCVCGVV